MTPAPLNGEPEPDGSSNPDPGERSGVIRVRIELVQEQLVERVLAAASGRLDEVSAPIELALGDALRAITGVEPESAPEADSLASSLARVGYGSRLVEVEAFEPARRPLTELRARIDDWFAREPSRGEAIKAVSRELALGEPDGKPEPGSGSWRIPGPGGHVRHFLALAAADRLLAEEQEGRQPPPQLADRGVAKRCFLYGFYARCCEEALGA